MIKSTISSYCLPVKVIQIVVMYSHKSYTTGISFNLNFKNKLVFFRSSKPLSKPIQNYFVISPHVCKFLCGSFSALLFILIVITFGGSQDDIFSNVLADPFDQMNFSKTKDVFSKDGVLETTITADYKIGKIDNKSITAMLYNDSLGGPILHVYPGDKIKLNLVNNLNESTNLHFHGLHVSPSNNSDNIFLEIAPGQTQDYEVDIPIDHPQGTYWYHSHMHSHAYEQVSGGLSGVIVVEGLEKLLPLPLQKIKEQIFAVRDFPVNGDPTVNTYRTVNGEVNPWVNITSGETQLWRFANIGSETVYNVGFPGHTFHVIAEDGNPVWDVWTTDNILLPSGKRFDVLVTANGSGYYPSKCHGLLPVSRNYNCKNKHTRGSRTT